MFTEKEYSLQRRKGEVPGFELSSTQLHHSREEANQQIRVYGSFVGFINYNAGVFAEHVREQNTCKEAPEKIKDSY